MVKIGKIIAFNIISLLTMINIFYIYYLYGFPKFALTLTFLKGIAAGVILIIFVWFITFLVNLSLIVSRAVAKKNLLRLSFLSLLILFISHLVLLIKNWYFYGPCYSCLLLVIFYLILTIICYSMLKELYQLINEIFNK